MVDDPCLCNGGQAVDTLVLGELYILRVSNFNKGDNIVFDLKDETNQPTGYQRASTVPAPGLVDPSPSLPIPACLLTSLPAVSALISPSLSLSLCVSDPTSGVSVCLSSVSVPGFGGEPEDWDFQLPVEVNPAFVPIDYLLIPARAETFQQGLDSLSHVIIIINIIIIIIIFFFFFFF
jgi:hypothetical protein